MFVGREEEIAALNELWGRDRGVLVTCRGRRRIGKSTLVEEFAARTADHFLAIEGLAPRKGLDDDAQRRHFCEKVAEFSGHEVGKSTTWSLAFAALEEALPERGRIVVLLDEISWLGGYNADFPGYLKEAWDRKFKKHPNLILVLCGSVSSWIAENILDNTGFVGRRSMDLELKELPPCDCVKMWGPSADRLSVREKIDLLSLTGGVPKYVEEVRPELTADENIRKLCFLPRGFLFKEFDDMFASVFGQRVKSRGSILRLLMSGPKTAAELAESEGGESSGNYTKVLRDLQLAGFVSGDGGLNPQTGKPLREVRYRIKDNYVRFYLHYVEPRKAAIENGLFDFTSLEQLEGWHVRLGLQFENLVLNHVQKLFPMLGLGRSLVLSAAPHVQKGTKRRKGCQIDLLIQTERTLFVVEIKRCKEIDHSIISEVEDKVMSLKYDHRQSVRTALVYDGDLVASVPASRYFDFLISAEELFGLKGQGR